MVAKKDISAGGFFSREFRMQALAAASVNIITYCNGISIGWFAPMLAKFQSPTETPLNFVVNVEESSWMGALIGLGGLTGNIFFGLLMDVIGRKACIYLVAVPHMCLWVLVYFAPSVEFLYAARFASGMTGGGTWSVIPIFIGEIADPAIRGRITALFTLTLNVGMMTGYIISSHVSYHIIPVSVILLPVLFLLIETFFPETPIYLLRSGKEEQAKKSLKFYMNHRDSMEKDTEQFNAKFEEMKSAVKQQQSQKSVTLRDYFTKRSLRALGIGLTVLFFNLATGSYALLSYMSSIFVAVKTEIHADTNTIIIGAVQIIGSFIAIILVDRFGRKILLMISTATTGLSLAAFGVYAYLVERTNINLSSFSTWLPLVLMALIILTANVGIIPVPAVLLVEILPPKIRAKAVAFCLCLTSVFAFTMLKVFPLLMDAFSVATAFWICAAFGGLGFFCITLFVPETKGRSMNTDEE